MGSTRREFVRAAALSLPAATGLLGSSAKGGGMQDGRDSSKVYGVGILGNCATHGAGVAGMFRGRSDTRVVAGYCPGPRRGAELADAMQLSLAESYEAVIDHPGVDFVAVCSDPCDKAALVESAAGAGKPIFLNKPFCESLDSARRIAAAVERHGVWLVHDIPMVRSVPVYARLLGEVRSGRYGAVMGYYHMFGMNFPKEFDLKAAWPERLDPPERSGGGEMTNMGCYALDYAAALLGRPKCVTAKRRRTWAVYEEAGVENYGQIVLDYGPFFAYLDVGKQQLAGESRHANHLTVNFEHDTLFVDASAGLVSVNHVPVDFAAFSQGATAVGSVEQLIAAMERGTPPTSDVQTALVATEMLMAAYASIVESRTVPLPLASGANPLVGSAAL